LAGESSCGRSSRTRVDNALSVGRILTAFNRRQGEVAGSLKQELHPELNLP
jgi:hypothetical protein